MPQDKKMSGTGCGQKSRGKAVKLFLVERLQILFNRDVIFWLILDSVPLPYIWHVRKISLVLGILSKISILSKQQQNVFKNHT